MDVIGSSSRHTSTGIFKYLCSTRDGYFHGMGIHFLSNRISLKLAPFSHFQMPHLAWGSVRRKNNRKRAQ